VSHLFVSFVCINIDSLAYFLERYLQGELSKGVAIEDRCTRPDAPASLIFGARSQRARWRWRSRPPHSHLIWNQVGASRAASSSRWNQAKWRMWRRSPTFLRAPVPSIQWNDTCRKDPKSHPVEWRVSKRSKRLHTFFPHYHAISYRSCFMMTQPSINFQLFYSKIARILYIDMLGRVRSNIWSLWVVGSVWYGSVTI